MIGKSAAVNLTSAKRAFVAKTFIDNSFFLFFIGFAMLIAGCLWAVYSENVILTYCALWIGFSGFIAILNSIFRLVKNIFYF